jgi:RNA polymerase sigma-70 factor (ECF subfamily)
MEASDQEVDELYECAFSVARRLLGDSHEAADCAQEATARALSRWPRISSYAQPWVVRVSSNLAIGILRKRSRLVVGLPDLGIPALSGLLDGAASRLDVRAGLMALPLRQRQVLVMRYIGDLTEEETARALSVSIASVKTHHRRGIDRLRRMLA